MPATQPIRVRESTGFARKSVAPARRASRSESGDAAAVIATTGAEAVDGVAGRVLRLLNGVSP